MLKGFRLRFFKNNKQINKRCLDKEKFKGYDNKCAKGTILKISN